MSYRISFIICLFLLGGTTVDSAPNNELTQSEIDSGYVLLFDGVQIDGDIWKQWDPKKADLERNRYTVDATEEAMRKRGGYPNGDIMIDSIYGDFIFKFEFKVLHQTGDDNGNSGIHYRSFDDEKWASASGIEYQIMDISSSVNNATAAAYGIYAPDPYPWKSQDWNMGIISANGNDVEHYLNDELVVKYNLESSGFLSTLGGSRFGTFTGTDPIDGRSVDFATSKRGWIILQDYGDLYDWWFRNLKITRLPIPDPPAPIKRLNELSKHIEISQFSESFNIKVNHSGSYTLRMISSDGTLLNVLDGGGGEYHRFSKKDFSGVFYLSLINDQSVVVNSRRIFIY